MFKIHALLIRYTPASQLTLEGFEHPFDQQLDPVNRWVVLAQLVPWDNLAQIYARNLRTESGRLTVDIRTVIGSLIVKHRLCLSDRDTVDQIAENLYIQYFCGLKSFQTAKPFDPSLLVDIRKRMGAEKFDAFNDAVIASTEKLRPAKKRIRKDDKPPTDGDDTDSEVNSEQTTDHPSEQDTPQPAENKPANRGTMKIDATVADQMIRYPTDLTLLNTAREESERIIDLLYEHKRKQFKVKPRTYRKEARNRYLNVIKKKRRTKNVIRKAIGQQLRYLRRNFKAIHTLLDMFDQESFPLTKRDQKLLWVIQLLYDQQESMYRENTRSCPNRLVNIYQPYVRPIVRGKAKINVEFGAKINISEFEGMSKVNRISWDAYNEAGDLVMQAEAFRSTFGCYPELLLADGIYMNRENRKWMKENGIRMVGKPLGRPPKEKLSPYQKRKRRKERNQRNLVEGKIGQGKNAHGLSKIRARRKDTSESWISAIFFVMNLTTLYKTWVKYGETGLFWALNLIYDRIHQSSILLKYLQQQIQPKFLTIPVTKSLRKI